MVSFSKTSGLLRLEFHRVKGDERILGDSDFVMEVLRASEEEMERRHRLKAEGYDLDKLAGKAADLFGVKGEDLLPPGKRGKVVEGGIYCVIGRCRSLVGVLRVWRSGLGFRSRQ